VSYPWLAFCFALLLSGAALALVRLLVVRTLDRLGSYQLKCTEVSAHRAALRRSLAETIRARCGDLADAAGPGLAVRARQFLGNARLDTGYQLAPGSVSSATGRGTEDRPGPGTDVARSPWRQ